MPESWHQLHVCRNVCCVFMAACVSLCRPSGQRKGGRCTARLRMQMGVASAQWWLLNRISAPEMPKAGSSASSWRRCIQHRHTRFCISDNARTCSFFTVCVCTLEFKDIWHQFKLLFMLLCCPNPLRDCTSQVHNPVFHFCIYSMDDISWMTTWEDESTFHPTLIELEHPFIVYQINQGYF